MEQDRSRLLGGGGHRRGPLYGEKTCRPQHGRQTTVTPSEGAQAVKAAGDGSLVRRQDATRGRSRTGGSGRKQPGTSAMPAGRESAWLEGRGPEGSNNHQLGQQFTSSPP